MSNRTPILIAALLSVWAAPIAVSQAPQKGPWPAFKFDRVLVDDVDGVVWARGSNWKASFSEEGMSFIPFLGSHAPKNYPVTLRLESVTAGGGEVALERGRGAIPDRSRVVINRGAMQEIYELALGQVEQLFRFERPVGHGDLVVRLAVETELAIAASEDGGLEFSNDLGGVRCSRAVVFDAAGQRAALETRVEDGVLELVVPAAFLEAAAFPVTIDPVFISFGWPLTQISGSQSPMFLNADVAYDSTTARFMVSYESIYSAADHDVYVISYYAGQNPLPTSKTATIDFTSDNWANPKIASNSFSPGFLVVAERTLSGGAIVIGARSVSAITFAPSAQWQVSTGEVGQKSNPDVGGDVSGFGYYCVVWQNDPPGGGNSNVYSRLASDTGPQGASTILGIVSGLYDDSHPSISKSNRHANPALQDWMVVFQRNLSPSNSDVWGQVIQWNGAIGVEVPIDTSAAQHTLPQVSTQGDYGPGIRRFVVVYEEHTGGPFQNPDTDIMAAVVDGAAVIDGPLNLTSLLWAPANDDQMTPAVDCDGTRFAVTFTEKGSLFASDQGKPFAAAVHLNWATTLGVTEAPALLSADLGPDEAIQVCSSWSGGGGQYEYMPVWHLLGGGGATSAIQGALYYGWSSNILNGPSGYYNYALPGCGGLGIVMSGYPIINQPISAQLTGVVGTPYMAIGTSIPPIALCTGCLLGIDPNTATIIQTDVLSGIVPNEGALVNTLIAVQGADIGATTGCQGSPPLTLSDEVIITIL
jgi:hypothetical protein